MGESSRYHLIKIPNGEVIRSRQIVEIIGSEQTPTIINIESSA
jgi:hypothetical protein